MRIGLLALVFAFAGCARTFVAKEYEAKDSTARVAELEQFLSTLRPDDPITLVMEDGTTNAGVYYSTQDGYVTIQQGTFFRDYKLTEIHKVQFRSESRNMKPLAFGLAGVIAAIIIFQFSRE